MFLFLFFRKLWMKVSAQTAEEIGEIIWIGVKVIHQEKYSIFKRGTPKPKGMAVRKQEANLWFGPRW